MEGLQDQVDTAGVPHRSSWLEFIEAHEPIPIGGVRVVLLLAGTTTIEQRLGPVAGGSEWKSNRGIDWYGLFEDGWVG